MRKLFSFLKIEILFNGHLQSLGAVSLVYLSSIYIYNFKPSVWLLLVIYLLFQSIYFYDRYRDLDDDEETNSIRVKHIRKYAQFISTIILTFLVVAVLLLLTMFNFGGLVFFVIVFLLGYFYPLYFKGLTKRIYLFKNIYVSGVHAVLVIFPLLATEVASVNFIFLCLFSIYIFIEAMIVQVLLDVKDVESDKGQGLLTLPVLIGAKKTIMSAAVLSILGFALIVLYLPVLAILSLMINFLVLYLLVNKNMAGFFLGASKFILWSIFQLL